MPNPAGINAFGGPFEREQPYGAIEKLKNQTALAPMSQSPSSTAALNAPKRSQRRAVRGRGSTGVAPASPPVMPPTQPQIPRESIIALFWSRLASEPGASDLVMEYARRASGY